MRTKRALAGPAADPVRLLLVATRSKGAAVGLGARRGLLLRKPTAAKQ
jgi:hypothetical protein